MHTVWHGSSIKLCYFVAKHCIFSMCDFDYVIFKGRVISPVGNFKSTGVKNMHFFKVLLFEF